MEFTEEEKRSFHEVLVEYRDYTDEDLILAWARKRIMGGYKWTLENNLYDDYQLLEFQLVDCGYWDVVERLINVGYKLTPRIMLHAVKASNPKAAKWLKDHGCPWNKEDLMTAMPKRCHYEPVIEWVKSL